MIDRYFKSINKLLLNISIIFLSAMVLLIIFNVIFRYFINISLTWSGEASSYSMIWSALLGAVILTNKDEHLSVDIMNVKGKARLVLNLVISILIAVFMAYTTFHGIEMVIKTIDQVASSMTFLSMGLVYLIMAIYSGLTFIGEILKGILNVKLLFVKMEVTQ